MGKAVGTPENRDAAFRVYAEHGGKNVPAMLEKLRDEHGIKISMPTFYAWKREGEWEKRLENQPPTFEERTLMKMMNLIESLEGSLSAGKEVDAQDVYAYTNMVNTFFRLARKLRPKMRTSPEEMRRKAEEILMYDYGIEPDRAKAIAAREPGKPG